MNTILTCLAAMCLSFAVAQGADAPATQPTTVPSRQARFLRLPKARDANPAAVVVDVKIADKDDAAQRQFQEAVKQPTPQILSDGKHLTLLALGPLLDSPDQVVFMGVEQEQKGLLIVTVNYTSARVAGTPLRRNVTWRPFLVLALPKSPISPGIPCKISVNWVCTDQPAAGQAAPAPLVTGTAFQIGKSK